MSGCYFGYFTKLSIGCCFVQKELLSKIECLGSLFLCQLKKQEK